MKHENPVEEIWRIREELSAEHGYDVHRIFAALREAEKQHGDRLVGWCLDAHRTPPQPPCVKNHQVPKHDAWRMPP